MDEQDLMGQAQHGPCKRRLSLASPLEFFGGISKDVDQADPANVVHLDLQKA